MEQDDKDDTLLDQNVNKEEEVASQETTLVPSVFSKDETNEPLIDGIIADKLLQEVKPVLKNLTENNLTETFFIYKLSVIQS